MNWDRVNLTSVFNEPPETPLGPFLERFRGKQADTRILDIGPGRHLRHFLLCARLGFDVWSVDISHSVAANWHANIQDFQCEPETFDIVLDIKTLCTEREPPYGKVHSWLKPGGYLFSVMPTDDHLTDPRAYPFSKEPRYQFEFLRAPTENEVKDLLPMYSECRMFKYWEPMVGNDFLLFNWCIEARK